MTITQSGAVGTGRITCTNEPNLTLSAIASAVSGCTQLGFNSYHIDRDIELLNCDFTMLREMLIITADISNGSVYGNGGGRRPPFFVRNDSTVVLTTSMIGFDCDQRGVSFVPWFGNSQSGFNTGQFEATECVFHLGNFEDYDTGVFFRMNDETTTFTFQSNQFIGGDPIRGWGSILGSVLSVNDSNRSYGSAVANIPNSVSSNNFAKDANIYTQFNTTFETDSTIDTPLGTNYSAGTIQILLRKDGTFTCRVIDSDPPKTYDLFNPNTGGTSGSKRANLDWVYRHNATITDGEDDLPEAGVRLDIVPTVISSPSVQTTKTSDTSGQFTETLVYHSRDHFRNTSPATEINSQYGPFKIRYWKYEFITQDRSGDSYDNRRNRETLRMLRDGSLTEQVEATVAAYTILSNLDRLRDRFKYETGANLSLIDAGAGGGVVSIPSVYSLVFNSSGSAFTLVGSTLTINSGTLDTGTNYSTLQVSNNVSFSGSSALSANLNVSSPSIVTAQNQDRVTGNVNILNGGTVELSDINSAQLTGTGSNGGLLKVNGATTSTTLDLRAYTINLGFEVENDSGVNITLRLNATQIVPTLTETSGTITVDNSAPLTVNNLTSAYIYLENNLGVQQDYQTLVSGTYNFGIPATATGTWKLVIDRQGFDRKSFSFTADGNAREFDGTLTQQVDLAGGAIYQAQSSSDVNIVGASSRIDVQNSTISGSVIYDMVQDYAVSATGMADDTVDALSYFPTDNGNYFSLATWQFRRDVSAVSLPTVNAIVSQNSDDPVDETNGQVSVQFSGGGLTATAKQDVRDSMALDLSVGVSPVAGSIDTTLNNTSVHSRSAASIRPSL